MHAKTLEIDFGEIKDIDPVSALLANNSWAAIRKFHGMQKVFACRDRVFAASETLATFWQLSAVKSHRLPQSVTQLFPRSCMRGSKFTMLSQIWMVHC